MKDVISGVMVVTVSLQSCWTSSLFLAFVFIDTKALNAVSDKYVVLNGRTTLVTACLASRGASVSFDNPKLFATVFLEIFFDTITLKVFHILEGGKYISSQNRFMCWVNSMHKDTCTVPANCFSSSGKCCNSSFNMFATHISQLFTLVNYDLARIPWFFFFFLQFHKTHHHNHCTAVCYIISWVSIHLFLSAFSKVARKKKRMETSEFWKTAKNSQKRRRWIFSAYR